MSEEARRTSEPVTGATTRGWRADGHYLALDTSCPVGSVAVARGGEVLARAFLTRQRRQSNEILPAIREVLGRAGLTPSSLDGLVVGDGPGSFTGLRVAAATAKGLAHALDLPVWVRSSLAAAALTDRVLPSGAGPPEWSGRTGALADEPPAIYVLFDARGDRVYAACYRTGAAVEEVVPPRATRLSLVLDGERPPGVVFAGDGALRHEASLRAAGHEVARLPAGAPTADALVRLVAAEPGPPLESPARWQPTYLRDSGADSPLTTRTRRA